MSGLRAFIALVRWDLAVEFRRKEASLNMCLFALLLLFIGSYAVAEKTELVDDFGPIFYWIAIIFSGTVGLSRAFLPERENGALSAIVTSPVDPGLIYLAKVVAVWIYVLVMALLVLGSYVILFDFEIYERHLDRALPLLGTTALFVLVYVSPGVLLGAMTAGLQGGEVVLRILLFPLLLPAIIVVLSANARLFTDPELPITHTSPATAMGTLGGLAAIYLASCTLLFPRVVEE